ncbi:MAG: hypothetical protein ABL986_00815 [Vicinamibacterales bacterium]
MSLRIACDLDGTVADMDFALQREAERLFGPTVILRAPVPPAEEEETEAEASVDGTRTAVADTADAPRVLNPREVRSLWSHVRKIDNFWTTLEEIEAGALQRFASLSAAHRWHVVFMTRRPQTRGENAQRQSQRWLQAKGFEFPSVCVVSHSRGVVAGALELNAVIDDRPETCLDVAADSKAEPILVWRGSPDTIPAGVTGLGVTAVPTFNAALDRLEELATAARRPGFIDRIKSALRPN